MILINVRTTDRPASWWQPLLKLFAMKYSVTKLGLYFALAEKLLDPLLDEWFLQNGIDRRPVSDKRQQDEQH